MTQSGGEDRRDDAETQHPLHGTAEPTTEGASTESPDDVGTEATRPPDEESELLGEGSESRAEDPDASEAPTPEEGEADAATGAAEARTTGTGRSGVGRSGAERGTTRRSRREAAGDVPAERLSAVPFILAAVLVIVLTGGALWWFLGRAEEEEPVEHTRAEDPTNGIILAEAPPEEWVAGDCLRDFDPEDDLSPATVISCDWDYDAQLIHWEDLDGDEHPGEDAAQEQAMEACDTAQREVLDQEAVAEYHALEGVVVHPDESTWEDDRRVNCLLQRVDGEPMNDNFVQDPEEDSSAETDDDAGEADDEDGGGETDAEDTEETE